MARRAVGRARHAADHAWTAAPHRGKYDPFAEWAIDQLDRQYGLWEPVVGEPRERVTETFT